MKDEKVDNVYPKSHIIPIIFEFLVELVILRGKRNASNFGENHKNGHFCSFFDHLGSISFMI